MKSGIVREGEYGGLTFKFDDGTVAHAGWIPEGELGDGQGGGFEEDAVDVGDSGLTAAEIVDLAYKNTGCGGSFVQIVC